MSYTVHVSVCLSHSIEASTLYERIKKTYIFYKEVLSFFHRGIQQEQLRKVQVNHYHHYYYYY